MIFIFYIKLFIMVPKKHTGQVNRKYDWQDFTILILPVQNNLFVLFQLVSNKGDSTPLK